MIVDIFDIYVFWCDCVEGEVNKYNWIFIINNLFVID